MADDASAFLDALVTVLAQEPGSVEELLIRRTVAPALEHIRLSSVQAARAPGPTTGASPGFLSRDQEELLVERAKHVGRGLARKLLQTTPKVRAKVSELDLLSPAEHSRVAAVDSALWHPSAVRALLEREEAMTEDALADRETWVLLATELAERMAYLDFPSTLVADLRAHCWSRLSELQLAQGEARHAVFTMTIAREHLAQGTGDPELVYDVTLRWAFLLWSQGRSSVTLLVLHTAQMLASASHDDSRLGYADLWLSAFYRHCGDPLRAEHAYQRAAGRFSSDLLSSLSLRQEKLFELFGLGSVPLDALQQDEPTP